MEIRLLRAMAAGIVPSAGAGERREELFRKCGIPLLAAAGILLLAVFDAHPQSSPRSTAGATSARYTLVQGLVCEDMRDGIPFNPAVAFSISAGKIYCYTLFDQIAEDTVVYHHWFFRDKPSARIRLSLKQPRWSTYSSIQLREADRGPWRVEISDAGGRVLKTLRFSVTD
jgi:hypothetical protein